MGKKLFILCMYTTFEKNKIGYVGLYESKQDIIQNIKYLNYNDLTYKQHKYKTPKSLFSCIEIQPRYKYIFNTYHLCNHHRHIK